MRILITGATGKIGRRAALRLRDRCEVRLLVRRPQDAASFDADAFETAVGDVTEPQSLLPTVRDIDAIVHLAAFFRGASPEQMDAVNHIGARELTRVGIAAGVKRFVFASTSLVYGNGPGRPALESDQTLPQAPYPKSKLAGERALMALGREHGLFPSILRLAFVYGDGDPHLNDWLPRLRAGPPNAPLQLVHHADVAEAIGLAVLRDDAHGIYNVADDETLSAHEILNLLGEASPWGGEAPPSQPIRSSGIMDATRIRAELGFRPEFSSLRTAIERQAL